MIRGEPAVCEMAKRLFPGSRGRGQGTARFFATKQAAGDLNWLMLRFPLRVNPADEGRWAEARGQALDRARTRQAWNVRDRWARPPAWFNGKLLPFQQRDLAFIVDNERTILADEQGLGKTWVSLAALAKTDEFPALVVCPPHLVKQWERRAGEILPGSVVQRLAGRTPYSLPSAHIYLTHYLLLEPWRRTLEDLSAPMVIFDEVQELRHDQTAKYSAASEIAGRAKRVLGMSGTPIHNYGAEIWRILNIIEFHCLGDYEAFTREWCEKYRTDMVVNPKLLGDYLRREGLMIRHLVQDVLPDLPKKRRVTEPVDVDAGTYGKLITEAVNLAMRSKDADPRQRGLEEEQAVNSARLAIGVAKAPAVAAFVRALVESGEPTLLFAHHHAVWRTYEGLLADLAPAKYTGLESPREKEAAKERFIRGETSLMMIALRSAAGIDGLQARAKCVVFGELDWSPAVHSQAEDRARRIGQASSVLCYYLVSGLEESTDRDMIDALGLKVQQFSGLMGDAPETEADREIAQQDARSHIASVVERLRRLGRSEETGPLSEPSRVPA